MDVLLPEGELAAPARGLEAAGAAEQDAVGGDLPQHGRPARHRRLPGAGDALSRHHRDARRSPQQPLSRVGRAQWQAGSPDKTAFVTAAAQGIGRATALAFAAEGAQVIATDVNEAKVAEIAGERIRTARLDVLHAAEIAAAGASAGPVDILFNCAGFVHQGTILDATEEEWDFAFDLNVRSMFRTIRAFLPGMLERGGGSIVNIASVAGSIKGVPNRFIYGATQGGGDRADQVGRRRFRRAAASAATASAPAPSQTPSLDERIAANAAADRLGRGGARRLRRPPADGPARHARGDRRAGRLSRPATSRNSSPARPSSSTAADSL